MIILISKASGSGFFVPQEKSLDFALGTNLMLFRSLVHFRVDNAVKVQKTLVSEDKDDDKMIYVDPLNKGQSSYRLFEIQKKIANLFRLST